MVGMIFFAVLRVLAWYIAFAAETPSDQGSIQTSLVQLHATSEACRLSRLVGQCVLLLFFALLHVPVALTVGQFVYVWKHSKPMWLSVAMTLQLAVVVMAFWSAVGAWKVGLLQASTSVAAAAAVLTVLTNTAKIFFDLGDKADILLFGSTCLHGSYILVNKVFVPIETRVLAWVVYAVLGVPWPFVLARYNQMPWNVAANLHGQQAQHRHEPDAIVSHQLVDLTSVLPDVTT
jgi:hypothetical protein